MNGLVRAVVFGFALAVCAPLAHADSLYVTGNVSFTSSSLTFAPPFTTLTNSGLFSAFSGGTVNYMLGTVPYTVGVPQTEEAFSITNSNGDVLAFYDQVNSPTQSLDSNGNLQVTLDESGYYTINGGSALAGTLSLGFDGTSPDGATDAVPFLATGSLDTPSIASITPAAMGVTPEPESILLMGTGFLGAAGLLRTRKRVS